MASIKFSAFTNEAVDAATTQLVGYKVGDTSANYRYSIAQLATALSPSISTFYTADGTIGTTRKALITDTIQFRNAGDTSDILKLNTDGTFALGLGASTTGSNQIAIGSSATVAAAHGIAIGSSSSGGSNGVSIGQSSLSAIGGIAIGYDSGSSTNNCINIGSTAAGTGANSITLNATGLSAAPSAASAFSVYMSSNTTPDLEVVGGGESTLNTSLKITGQGYTELYDTANTTLTVDWNNSNIQELTGLTGSHTFTASNPKAGATYILTLAQTGAVTATWTGVSWPGGTAPTLSGNTKTDVVTLICYDATGAGLYYGSATLDLA